MCQKSSLNNFWGVPLAWKKGGGGYDMFPYKQLNTLKTVCLVMQQDTLIGYISAYIINKWYQQITKAQYILNKILLSNFKNGFSMFVSYLCSRVIQYNDNSLESLNWLKI